MEASGIMFALLRFEINEIELCNDVKNSITSDILSGLYTLSKQHDLAHLVGDALDKNGLLPETSEVKKRFLQERNLAVYRYEQMQYELQALSEILEEAKIPFIPLKGSVLRDYYPTPWMRTSCDIDVLVKKEDLNAAIDVLEKKLNYNCESITAHDAQIYAESGVHVELHYTLWKTDDDNALKEVLDGVWEEDVTGTSYRRTMSDGMFYCYFVAHMAGHVREGGCGVRPFVDLWILNNKVPQDAPARAAFLQKTGLQAFAKAAERLSEVWISGADSDPLSADLAEYVLNGGVYGSMVNRVAVQSEKKKGKVRFLLSRIFLPYDQLKFQYPKLQKYPILYPFYQIKRWFKLLGKESRQKAVRELNETKNGDKEKQERIVKLLKDLEL